MMDWLLKSMKKKMRVKDGWRFTLAVCACSLFLAVGTAGAGIVKPPEDGAIGGRAWCDVNEDGKRQNAEPLLQDVAVTLRKLGDDGIWADFKTTTTNAKGRYNFKNLELGAYLVVFEDKGLYFTKPNIGNDKRDSDVTKIYIGAGRTSRITLDAHDPTNYSTDAGYVDCTTQPPDDGLISGKAWCDIEGDGKRQDSDTLLPDVKVFLQKQLPDGGLEVIATTTTDDLGQYEFAGLPFGTYVVAFEDNGQAFTTPDAADDCRDSDVVDQIDGPGLTVGFTAPIVLDEHEPISTCTDAGYVGCAEKECIHIVFHGSAASITGIAFQSPRYNKSYFTTMISIDTSKLLGTRVQEFSADFSELIDRFRSALGIDNFGITQTQEHYGTYTYFFRGTTNTPDYMALKILLDDIQSNGFYFEARFVDYEGKSKHVCIKVKGGAFGISPIALDIDSSGAVERITGEFEFNFTADGESIKAAEWFAPSEGILVDTRIAGPMTGAHLFGDMGGKYADGYAKLATLDVNADGAVSGAELAGLAIWTDANSNAMADEGEISSLTAHRIISLSTRHTGYLSTVTLANGATMVAEDLWFPVVLPPAAPVATPVVSIKTLTFWLGGAILLALLIAAVRRSSRDSVPEAA